MSEQPEPQIPARLVFRVPTVAVLAALLFAICATPVAFGAPGLVAIYLIPIAAVVWVLRVRTTATADGLTVRGVVGSRALPWASLKGFRLSPKGQVRAVLTDDREVPLPSVRTRHLPALSLVSGGRLADPTVAPETADDDEPVATETSDTAATAAEPTPGVPSDAEPTPESGTESDPDARDAARARSTPE
ncbi:PH domain-containing protein [Actinokineospora enzanensis]|uniref:PH domain-containing protein n=1 Tax=Actinokineospora enzanensis TaxID=155975 RepID=UPI000377B9BC|nr:PH domain-containing protein [Actinokineospora enzanensis]